jgi:hypothetical protein
VKKGYRAVFDARLKKGSVEIRKQAHPGLRGIDAYTVEGSVNEYRVYTVDTAGNSLKAIDLDCTDDKAAVKSAKQFIDGHDIELWQLDRKVATFQHKRK